MVPSKSPSPEVPYKVGRGHPPIETRFKPGQSGNPKGRRKGSRNLKKRLQDALLELVTVKFGSRTRRVTKLEALVAKQWELGIKGDHRAVHALINIAKAVGAFDEDKSDINDDFWTPEKMALISDEAFEELDEIIRGVRTEKKSRDDD